MSKKFQVNYEMPKNADEAMQVLDYWGQGTCFSFSAARAKKIADIIHYERGVSIDTALDDHRISLIVNQLRDRIAHIIVPYLRRVK